MALYPAGLYSAIIRTIYNKVLHWFYIINFYALIILVSLLIQNNALAPLLFLGEAFLVLFFLMGLFIASLYNLYYLIGFSFFVLIMGALELAINILILLM